MACSRRTDRSRQRRLLVPRTSPGTRACHKTRWHPCRRPARRSRTGTVRRRRTPADRCTTLGRCSRPCSAGRRPGRRHATRRSCLRLGKRHRSACPAGSRHRLRNSRRQGYTEWCRCHPRYTWCTPPRTPFHRQAYPRVGRRRSYHRLLSRQRSPSSTCRRCQPCPSSSRCCWPRHRQHRPLPRCPRWSCHRGRWSVCTHRSLTRSRLPPRACVLTTPHMMFAPTHQFVMRRLLRRSQTARSAASAAGTACQIAASSSGRSATRWR